MFRTVLLSINGSFSVYTQQWYMPYRFADSLRAGSEWNCSSILILLARSQQTCMTYTIAVCILKIPDDGQRNCPKHVEFHSKKKFEKLVHLAGFITRNLSRCMITRTSENKNNMIHYTAYYLPGNASKKPTPKNLHMKYDIADNKQHHSTTTAHNYFRV